MTAPVEKLYTVPEVAAHFRVDRQTVRLWLRSGKFPNAIQPGRAWLIPHQDLVKVTKERHGNG